VAAAPMVKVLDVRSVLEGPPATGQHHSSKQGQGGEDSQHRRLRLSTSQSRRRTAPAGGRGISGTTADGNDCITFPDSDH
jgi:hypothetical protein